MESMKFLVVIAAICVGFIDSVPVQKGLRYYRAPSFSGYYRPYPVQQTMLLHYNNPYSARSSHASEITAFAAGDRIGTGTYYEQGHQEPAQDFQPPPKPVADFDHQPESDESSGNAVSIAESYPEADESSDTEQQHQEENDVLFEPKPTISYEPIPQKNNVAPTATPATPLIAKPPKINVEIENTEDDDEDVVPKKQQQQPNQGSWPLNNFFPISFGSTSGGAIAIANSFSTGKGGTAASRATAYGSSSKEKAGKKF